MSYLITKNLLCILSLAGIALLFVSPAHAFTADSLDISIDKNGDAVAGFTFTLEGFLENAIPQSMLEEELKKGLTTRSEPPVLLSMDRSGATMLLKKFADTRDVEQGTEYRTASMNFQTAESALKNSALGSVVAADFSPATITIRFPDAYTQQFENATVLPSLTHIVNDHSIPAAAAPADTAGTINLTASPEIVQVSVDGIYKGETPQVISGIPEGMHTILARRDGFLPVTKNVTVVGGMITHVFVFLEHTVQPTTEPLQPVPSGGRPLPGFGVITVCLAIGSRVMMRRMSR
jgi:hypothetical protein